MSSDLLSRNESTGSLSTPVGTLGMRRASPQTNRQLIENAQR